MFLLLLLVGCTSTSSVPSSESAQTEIPSDFTQRTPTFSCVSETVLDEVWHCVQVYEDTPAAQKDWWADKCEVLGGVARSVAEGSCPTNTGYACPATGNLWVEFYYTEAPEGKECITLQ